MLRVNIFGLQNCGDCLRMKGRVENALRRFGLSRHVQVVFWDQNTVDGRAEGAWYDVDDTLPVVVIEKDNRHIARWEGRAPKSEELLLCLESARGAVAAG